jgi:hypothetical protein
MIMAMRVLFIPAQTDAPNPLLPDTGGAIWGAVLVLILLILLVVVLGVIAWRISWYVVSTRRTAEQAADDVAQLRRELSSDKR